MNEKETTPQGSKAVYPKLDLASKILGSFFTLLGGFLWIRTYHKHCEELNHNALWNDAMWGTISFFIGCGSFMLSTLTKGHTRKKRKATILYVIVYGVVLILAVIAIRYIINFFLDDFL